MVECTMHLNDRFKPILKHIFNPFGIAGIIVPSYGDFWKGQEATKRTIVHEAGHATANYFTAHGGKPLKLTIRPDFKKRMKGVSGCFSVGFGKEDISELNVNQLHSMIVMLQASKAAEFIVFGSLSPERNYGADDKLSKKALRLLFGSITAEEEQKLLKDYEVQASKLLKDEKIFFYRVCEKLESKHTLDSTDLEKLFSNHLEHRPK
jgi:hypothetical protein